MGMGSTPVAEGDENRFAGFFLLLFYIKRRTCFQNQVRRISREWRG
jgi:hypothetical protein